MKIAVVGSGIAGLSVAWLLARRHEVVLFEAANRLGGHSNTVEVETPEGPIPVDTGFIVYNRTNYPHFTRLLAELGVASEPSDMSFSYSAASGFEYEGSARGLLAAGGNFFRPRAWRLLSEALRFYRDAPGFLAVGDPEVSLGDFLARAGYSEGFLHDHLLPMGAAIWSCSPDDMMAFPAVSFLRFFHNHGLLRLAGRPRWRTVSGGSRRYVEPMAARLAGRIRLATPVIAVRRQADCVVLSTPAGEELFDQAVLACHGDQALALLGAAATPLERSLLAAFRYQTNRTILHGDAGLMPRRRSVWASWNYLGGPKLMGRRAVAVTYWMNRLQNLAARPPLFVSLNPFSEPAAGSRFAEFRYDHPLFDRSAIAAQQLLPTIQGQARVWFCGSYCGYGFHEDALESAIAVATALGAPAPWASEVAAASPAAENATPRAAAIAAE